MKQAAAKRTPVAYGVALGRLLVMSIEQDTRIEAVRCPPALRTRMTPILARMKKIDSPRRWR